MIVKLKYIIIILLMLEYGKSIAQKQGTALIDSLENEIPKKLNDTSKVKLLCDLSFYCFRSNSDKGIKYGLEALELSNTLHWKKGIARSNRVLGINYRSRSNYPMALDYDMKALKIIEEINDTNDLSAILTNIGVVYFCLGDDSIALKYYDRSYNINVKQKKEVGIALDLNNIGEIYLRMGQFQKAKENFTRALEIERKLNNRNHIALNLDDLGQVYIKTNKFDSGLVFEYEAFKIFDSLGDNLYMSLVLGNIGKCFLKMAKIDNDIVKEKNIFNNNIIRAIYYLQKAIRFCVIAKNFDGLQEYSLYLSEAEEKSGNYKDAINDYKQYVLYKDSVFSKANTVKIANIETQREKELKEKEIEIERLKTRTKETYFYSGIAILLVILAITMRGNGIQKKLNKTITKLVNEQEATIQQRTVQLAESNDRLAHANKKLVELIQYNAHNLREPLARVMGAMIIQEYVTSEEFYADIWPQMQKAVTDLDNSIKEVITIADETVNLYG